MADATRDLGRESYWRTVLARWRRGGLSVRAFCQAEGVSEPTFYAWRRKLEQAESKKPAFLPVHVVADVVEPPAIRGIEIVLANGRCLRVQPGFDPTTLVKLIDPSKLGDPHAELAPNRPHLARGSTGRSAKIVRFFGHGCV